MTTQEKIEAIRLACIKVNPDIDKEQEIADQFLDELDRLPCDAEEAFGKIPPVDRPIRLADVLFVIGNNQDKWREKCWFTWVFPVAQELGKDGEWANFCGYSHQKGWALLTNYDKCPVGWNLREDDLSEQTPETINFIHELLS